jgi:hypothetical protein
VSETKSPSIYNLLDSPREQQANEALGQAYAGAVDPETGRFDPLKFNALAAKDPATALALKGGIESGQSLQTSQYNLSAAQNAQLAGALSGVLELPDDKLKDGVLQATQRLVAAGVMPLDRAKAGLLNLSPDPATLRTQLQQLQLQTMTPEERQTMIGGRQGTYTGPGGNLAGYTQNPRTGAVSTPPQPGAPLGLTPEALDKPFTYKDDTGKELTTTYRQWLTDHGFSFPASGGTGGGPGNLPSTLRNPNKPATSTQPGSSTTPQPGPQPVPTAPSPVDIKQQEAEAAASTAAFRNISDQAVASRGRSSILGNMLADTKQFFTGPQADIVAKLRNLGQAIGIKGDVDAQTSYESFNKLAAQLANAQGAGSDARLSVNVEANPHGTLSPAGVNLMIRQLQGNEDYLQARATMAAKWPDQKKVNAFENEHGSKLDPRAFQFARMTPGQQVTYIDNLSAKDKAAVQESYNWAHKQGLIK